jgi:hypothetical protein
MGRFQRILIDNKDAWGEYGFFALKDTLDEWLAFPDRKEPFTHDWEDEDGIEVDLDNVYVKEKNASLNVLFVAGSPEQFRRNYDRAKAMLTAPGLRTVYLGELEMTFGAYYTRTSNVSTITRMRSVNKVMAQMTLHFVIPAPTTDYFTMAEMLFGSEQQTITTNGANTVTVY